MVDVDKEFDTVFRGGQDKLHRQSVALVSHSGAFIALHSMTEGFFETFPAAVGVCSSVELMAVLSAVLTVGYEAGRNVGRLETEEAINAANSTPVS